MILPFISYGKMDFPKATRLKFITASDGHYGQPDTDFEDSHRQLLEAINKENKANVIKTTKRIPFDSVRLTRIIFSSL